MADVTTMVAEATTAASTAAVKSHLVISTMVQKPFVFQTISGDKVSYHGFLVDIIDEVAKVLKDKFTYEIKMAADATYGRETATGWTGILGEVHRGEADFGLAPFTVTPEREKAFEFTKPVMTDSVNLLVQKPHWFDLGLGYLVRPFAGEMWIMLLVALLLIGLVFFVIGKFSPYEWGNQAADKDPRGARNSFSLRNSYLFALSTLTWQGYREAPRSISGRITAAFWWIFVVFTLIAYTANLTAYMLSRPEQLPDLPFKNYEELVENSEMTVSALNFGTTERNLMTSRSATLKSIWTKMNQRNTWIQDFDEGVQRVETGNGNVVTFMQASSALYYARVAEKCNIMVYGEDLFPSSHAIAVGKSDKARHFKVEINKVIRDMKNSGMLDRLHDKYWKFGGSCNNIDGRKFISSAGFLSTMPIYPVTLKDMAVAILLFFLGLLAAIVFLIVEIVHYAVTKKGKKLHRPAIVKNPPKIFKPKAKKASKPGPSEIEAAEEAGGASADPDALELESVPLDDTPADTVETVEEVEQPLMEEEAGKEGKVEV